MKVAQEHPNPTTIPIDFSELPKTAKEYLGRTVDHLHFGWHFAGHNYPSGRLVSIQQAPLWIETHGRPRDYPVWCNFLTALEKQEGSLLCQVEVDEGTQQADDGLLLCRRRRILRGADMDSVGRNWSCEQAMSCLERVVAPRCVVEYLSTGNLELRRLARIAAIDRSLTYEKESAGIHDLPIVKLACNRAKGHSIAHMILHHLAAKEDGDSYEAKISKVAMGLEAYFLSAMPTIKERSYG